MEESSELSGQFFEDETRNACDLSYFYVLIIVRIDDGRRLFALFCRGESVAENSWKSVMGILSFMEIL